MRGRGGERRLAPGRSSWGGGTAQTRQTWRWCWRRRGVGRVGLRASAARSGRVGGRMMRAGASSTHLIEYTTQPHRALLVCASRMSITPMAAATKTA